MTDENSSSTSTNYLKYKSKNPLQSYLLDRFLKKISLFVKPLNPDSLLDVGCGEGFVLSKLKNDKVLPKNVAGIDISDKALKMAKSALSEVKFEISDVRSLPYKDNSFDLLVCLEVLEHITDYKKALRELVRVSNKYLLISVPWEPFFSLANILRGKNVTLLGKDPQHVNYWSKGKFNKLLVTTGHCVVFHKIVFPWQVVLIKVV
jgi:SAM-dependent methyltransferase